MGLEHLTAVLDHSRQGGSRLVVLMVVASYSDQRGEWIVDQATLQKRARLGRRRVQQLLDELVASGEPGVCSNDGGGKPPPHLWRAEEKRPKRSPLLKKGKGGSPFPAKKGEGVGPFPLKKGEGVCPFPLKKGEAESPFRGE